MCRWEPMFVGSCVPHWSTQVQRYQVVWHGYAAEDTGRSHDVTGLLAI
jgi:hypothetical protein